MQTQIDIHRHPIKSGEFLPQQMDPAKDIALPVEGLQQAQAEAARFAEEFAAAPEGTIVWSLASTAPRTQEAQFIFDMELKTVARKLKKETGEEISIIDLHGSMPDKKIKDDIDSAVTDDGRKKKVVLINGPHTDMLGPGDYDLEQYEKLMDELGSEEELIARWPEFEEVSRRINVNYNEVADGFEKLMGSIVQAQKNLFPNRNVWVKAFGHSAEVEVALATWSKLSTQDILSLGKGGMVGFLESARVELDPEGNQSITYRDSQLLRLPKAIDPL